MARLIIELQGLEEDLNRIEDQLRANTKVALLHVCGKSDHPQDAISIVENWRESARLVNTSLFKEK